MAAAATLADSAGFDAVTVAAVARRLGVQPASLYEHITDRDALLDGLQRVALGELGARLGDEIAGRSAKEALRGFVEAHRAYADEHPGAWQALQRNTSAQTAQSAEKAKVGSLTIAVIRGYPVPADAVIHASRLVGATVNGLLALTRSGAFSHRPDPYEESWLAAVDALDRALTTWPTEGTSA